MFINVIQDPALVIGLDACGNKKYHSLWISVTGSGKLGKFNSSLAPSELM